MGIQGWLCDLRDKTVHPHQVKMVLSMYWGRAVLDAGRRMGLRVGFQRSRNVLAAAGVGSCAWRGGLLVGWDVSVGFGLGRLPRGGGVWWVRDRGDAVCQGS